MDQRVLSVTLFLLTVLILVHPTGPKAQTSPVIKVESGTDHFSCAGCVTNPGSEQVPTFLIMVSYFDALRATSAAWDTDLQWLSQHSLSGVRILPNFQNYCSGAPNTDALIDGVTGAINSGRLQKLKDFVAKAGSYGLIVDVTFIDTDVQNGTGYAEAMRDVVFQLRPYGNVIVDVHNESNLYFSQSQVGAFVATVHSSSGDPLRAVTGSTTTTVSLSDQDAGQFAREQALDFVAHHEARGSAWYTTSTISTVLNSIRSGLSPAVKPIYLQEPKPFDPGCNNSSVYDDTLAHAATAVAATRQHGGAAWTFHTRKGFALTGTSLKVELSLAERSTVEGLRAAANSACWGANALAVSPQSIAVGAGGGSGTIQVTTNGTCSAQQGWSATTSDDTWLHRTPTSGNGAGTVTYTVDANPTCGREGTLTIGGRIVRVSQTTTNALTPGFTDDPLVGGANGANGTTIKGVHIRELRSRIDGLRAARSLSPFGWAEAIIDGATNPPGTTISSSHIQELRTVLNAEYTARAVPLPGYSTGATAGQFVQAADINDLRQFVIDLENSCQ